MNTTSLSLLQAVTCLLFTPGMLLISSLVLVPQQAFAGGGEEPAIHLGLRPHLLLLDMDQGALKSKLENCARGPFKRSDFSIGHRGAPLGYPEHTRESYVAAARMGAGIVECDVTFTRDKALVCRHSQCDLHTTTNILETELAQKCGTQFRPAVLDDAGSLVEPATANCCTSDITLTEFQSLRGKRDHFNPRASNAEEFLQGELADNAIDGMSTGTLLTHRESIALFQQLGVKMAPELKAPSVAMPFQGLSQQGYAQLMIDEYKQAGVPPGRVWPQSFDLQDVMYWIANEPAFGRQAVYLDDRDSDPSFDHRDPASWDVSMEQLAARGVNVIAAPIWMLLDVEDGVIVPSRYARAAKTAGLDIIAWTFERSGLLKEGGGWYYQTLNGENPNVSGAESRAINSEGDAIRVLHVLAKEVGVRGVFSDWPATITYYANCMGLD